MADKQQPEKVDQQSPAADTDVRHDPQLDTDPNGTTDKINKPSGPGPSDGETLVRPADDTLPFLILSSRYDVGRELGKGGMGVVLLATDRSLNRQVAIKRILVPNEPALKRFITEARSIAALSHNHIVQIHEIARDPEGPFLVLEYVGGGSLLDRLQEGALDLDDAIQITCQICDALTLAHSKGIIHRDIKPANILLTAEGHPKLTDFGLARDLESMSGQTLTGAGMGTPLYVPPEQWRDATSVDARSDLWSLAVTCYQMITGSNPKVIRLDQLPRTLAPVIGTMLEENPDKRYASAEEFKNELRNAMAASAGAVSLDLIAGLCPACNTANNASRKFCRNCRASLIDPCLSCDTGNPVWEDICGECGHSQHERRNEIRILLSASLEKSLSFARAYEYEKALAQLADVQESAYSFTADIREQATKEFTLIRSQQQEQHRLKDELLQLAQQHLREFDFAAAARELKNIPPPLRRLDDHCADSLLATAEKRHAELSVLTEEILLAITNKQLSGLANKTTRYLKLKPNDEKFLALHEKLKSREDRDRRQAEKLIVEAETAFKNHQDEAVLKSLNNWPGHLHRPPRAIKLQESAQDRLGHVQEVKSSIAKETNASRKRRLVKTYLRLRPEDTQAHNLLLQLDAETKDKWNRDRLTFIRQSAILLIYLSSTIEVLRRPVFWALFPLVSLSIAGVLIARVRVFLYLSVAFLLFSLPITFFHYTGLIRAPVNPLVRTGLPFLSAWFVFMLVTGIGSWMLIGIRSRYQARLREIIDNLKQKQMELITYSFTAVALLLLLTVFIDGTFVDLGMRGDMFSPRTQESGNTNRGRDLLPSPPIATLVPEFDLSSSLVAHYPFDGDAKDLSGNGHHATFLIGQSPPTLRAGFVRNRHSSLGSAISLTGNQHVVTPDLGLHVERSVTAWIFPESRTSVAYVLTQVSMDRRKRWHFTITQVRRKAVSYHAVERKDNAPYDIDLPISFATPGRWSHVAFVHSAAADGANTRVFIDGTFIGATSSRAIEPVEGNYHINAAWTHLRQWHYGAAHYDDISIYNRALSAEEIQAIYEYEKP